MSLGFFFSDEHKVLRESVKTFGKNVRSKVIELDKKHEYDKSIIKKMGKEGYLGVCIPEKYGGVGMDYMALGIVSEELEYIDSSLRVVISVHVGLNSLGLLQWGNEEQKTKYLIPQATGNKLATYALTEPSAGSDVSGIKSHIKKEGDEYILNGNKIWISLAAVADNFLTFAYTDPSKGNRGISAFIIERNFKGVSTGSLKEKLGVRAGNTGFINYDDVAIPKENLLGKEGEGFKIAMTCLDNGRYTVAAGSVGLAKAAKNASVKYANERSTFGKKIREHQLVQRLVAHMVKNITASELLVYNAGWMKNKGLRNTRETALAKWHATNTASQCADDAIQIHGAYGFSAEYPVERYWRNSRGARIYEGTDQIQELMQGQYALGLRQDKPLRNELPSWAPNE